MNTRKSKPSPSLTQAARSRRLLDLERNDELLDELLAVLEQLVVRARALGKSSES